MNVSLGEMSPDKLLALLLHASARVEFDFFFLPSEEKDCHRDDSDYIPQ
jgi:hypothetical protein